MRMLLRRLVYCNPVAPPTSHNVLNFEKSNYAINASKLIREKASHRAQELISFGNSSLQLLEKPLLTVLGLVLQLARAQHIRQIFLRS